MTRQKELTENPKKYVSILFMDIEGYTAMMHQDEAHALEVIQKFNRVVKSETQKAGGSIIQYYGDACLITFDHAQSAVQCACAMQLVFSDGIKIPVRMGIHSGDVWYKQENIYGDAVNIASRIESMGVPGAVLVSSNVREQLDGKEFGTVSLGKFHFKNVPRPMEVHALKHAGIHLPQRQELRGKVQSRQASARRNQMLLGFSLLMIMLLIAMIGFRIWDSSPPETSFPILAVYPLETEKNTPARDGHLLAVSIAEKFSKTSGLITISPDDLRKARKVMHQANFLPINSEQSFLDTLKATHYLKGTLGEKIRLQLFQASKADPQWEGAFEPGQSSETMKQIYFEIIGHLGIRPSPGVLAQFDAQRDERVIELFKKALQNWNDRQNPENFFSVIDYLMQARSLDSTDQQVNGLLALAYQTGIEREYYAEIEVSDIQEKVLRYAELALAFHPGQPYALIARGSHAFYSGDYSAARESLEKAHEVAPEMGMTTQALADFSLYTGDYANALRYIKQANSATPGDKTILRYMSWCLMSNGLVEASRENTERLIMFYPELKEGNYYLWAYHLIMKDDAAALKYIPAGMSPAFRSLMEGIVYLDFGQEENFRQILEALRQRIRSECDTLSTFIPRERIPEDQPLFRTLGDPFGNSPEGFNREIDELLSQIKQYFPAGENDERIIASSKRLESYESALNSLVLLGYIHKGREAEQEKARRFYKQFMAEGKRLPIHWLVQTYPFECFNSFRSDAAIQEIASGYGINFAPHPWFRMQQEAG